MLPLDARSLTDLSPYWKAEAEFWRGATFAWKRWTSTPGRPVRDHSDHSHCRFCWACICDARDHDPYDKPGPAEGGHFRQAYYAEKNSLHAWVCRTCFKRLQPEYGWIRLRSGRLSPAPAGN